MWQKRDPWEGEWRGWGKAREREKG